MTVHKKLGDEKMSEIEDLLYTIPAVLIAISMHEFAHGYVSYKLGDPTPKQSGRLSLNPFRHLDLVGTLCLMFFHFGWAKPVMVNPYYYKKRKKGMLLVALGGPIMNFFIAFMSLLTMGLMIKVTGGFITSSLVMVVFNGLQYMVIINLGLGVFNLIPVPPLDGSKVLGAVLPEDKYFKYMQYERYGSLILILLLVIGVLSGPLSFVTNLLHNGMVDIVSLILRI